MRSRLAAVCLRALPLVAGLLLAPASAAPAGAPYPPELNAGAYAGFDAYRLLGFNKAFAVNRDGKWAYRQNMAKSVPVLVEETLKACNQDAKLPCRVVSVNDRDTTGLDPLKLNETNGAALGPLVPAPYYPIRGAEAAAGILIWSHGVLPGDDNTRQPPHGYVNRFRDAGYDIYKFDRRQPDYGSDLATLRSAVEMVRETGYHRVVLAGQSTGAWLSLETAAKGAAVDGVIAAAPARFGKQITSMQREKNRDNLMPILRDFAARDLAGVIMFFAQDDYDPGGRSEYVRTLFARSTRARVLVIDGPDGITGHGGAASARFVTEYGACLSEFILKQARTAPCG